MIQKLFSESAPSAEMTNDELLLLQSWPVILARAIYYSNKGIDAENEKDYKLALKLYNESQKYFQDCILNKLTDEEAKEMVSAKSKYFKERADKIRSLLKKQKKKAKQEENQSANFKGLSIN